MSSPRPPTARRNSCRGNGSAVNPKQAGDSPFLAQLLAFEASPVAVAALICAQRGGHHRHTTAWADRRPVIHSRVSVSDLAPIRSEEHTSELQSRFGIS